ncbi:MAG: putative colanic acid biosynthesis acetyltransferase [Verrucomicrobia bacterium]|nr:putative colanic acid biosynthesis acetyltransferase [Verrucomicrobiota bacterium]MBI3870634.1 putative colanic acid biosynthesis acetyltransferase [Verrucomicrobiota bacterium]
MTHALPNIEADPYKRPAFSPANRLRRASWQALWLLVVRWSPTPLFGWRQRVFSLMGARLASPVHIYPCTRVWAPWNLRVDAMATLGRDVEIYNPAPIHVGHHCIVSQGAYLCGASHDYNDATFPLIAKPIALGPYSWICARAIVLPGVKVGEGAVLAAGSVATKDLNPWTVYGGNPARALKARTPQPTPES